MIQPPKTPIKQFKKEVISKLDFTEKFLIRSFIVQLKIVDSNYYKSNSDYSVKVKLNPFHPISYLLIIYMILKGIFTRELDYECFSDNIKIIFQWQEE